MQKRVALVSVLVTVGAAVLGAAACEESAESTFPEPHEDAAAEASGPGFIPPPQDGSVGDELAPAKECAPSLPEPFEPTWRPPTKAGACESEELGGYYDACVSAPEGDAGDPCSTWRDAHAACAACLEPADDNGPVQFYKERRLYGLNVAGCLAILRDEREEGGCPAAYAAAVQCQRASCDACSLRSQAEFAEYNRCQREARETVCKPYDDAVRAACPPGFNAPDGGAFDCFRASTSEGERAHFVRVEGIFCGK